MKRYIDADALVKDIENRRLVFKDTITVAEAMKAQGNAIRKAIGEAPTADVVEVVRCKDCKFFKYGDYCTEGKMEHSRCRENDYCSYGERSEEC